MTAAALHGPTTFGAAQALADRLSRYTPKELAKRLGVSARTTEKWKAGEAAPTFKHTVAFLADEELARDFLIACGRVDLANAEEALAVVRKLREVADEAG